MLLVARESARNNLDERQKERIGSMRRDFTAYLGHRSVKSMVPELLLTMKTKRRREEVLPGNSSDAARVVADSR